MSCLFCDIVESKRGQIIFENDYVMAFMDIDPITKGHVLIITKEHRLDLDELMDIEMLHVLRIAKRLIKVFKKLYNIDGYSMMQNGGKFNDIGHYHMHLFPRQEDDGFDWGYGTVEPHDITILRSQLTEGLEGK